MKTNHSEEYNRIVSADNNNNNINASLLTFAPVIELLKKEVRGKKVSSN